MKKALISLLVLSCLLLTAPVNESSYADSQKNVTVSQNTKLTQEQAKELLIKYNNEVDYIYQGNASDFEALKAKNLNGYVFLPDADGDIGYFVNENTSEIYYFHPSGYLELVNQQQNNK
ncbi:MULTISPECIES: hypothetical protein [unclassified Clostridioides]|uniref:hypothetical protein n=1 Tax=unclassified Clostridioides TaxID=2635829 RepID=UPI0038A35BE2